LNYVFLDTIDDSFIERIADKVCPILIDKLTKDYLAYIKQPHGIFTYKKLKEYVEEEGKNITFLNCYYILDGTICTEKDCFFNHTAVFVQDQYNIFVNKITKFKDKVKESIPDDDVSGLTRFFVAFNNIVFSDKFGSKMIKIPVNYSKEHEKYLPFYYNKAKRIGRTDRIKKFFYVRADTVNSDYEEFKKNTGLSVEHCDCIKDKV